MCMCVDLVLKDYNMLEHGEQVAELQKKGEIVGMVRGCIKYVGTKFWGGHVKLGCILGLRVSPRHRYCFSLSLWTELMHHHHNLIILKHWFKGKGLNFEYRSYSGNCSNANMIFNNSVILYCWKDVKQNLSKYDELIAYVIYDCVMLQ